MCWRAFPSHALAYLYSISPRKERPVPRGQKGYSVVPLWLQPQLPGHLSSHVPQRYGLGRVRDSLQEWVVSVDTATHSNVHRDTSELLKSRVRNGPLALTAGEDLDGLTAMGTVEVAHVLDHAHNRHVSLTEQAHRAVGVHQ